MELKSALGAFLLIILLVISILASADTPPANTIPVIGLKANYEDINTEFFCFLSWNYFDGLSRQFYQAEDILENVVLPGDITGMLTLVNPWEITCMTNWFSHMFPMDSTLAFARPVWKGYSSGGITYTEDALIDSLTAVECKSEMENIAAEMDSLFNQSSHSVWFYYGFDEAPAIQWNHMVNDSSAYDNFMPSLFTQQMDSVYRPDIDSTMKWQPTLEEVDPSGVISWMKWHIHLADSTRDQNYIISTMHTMKDWAGINNIEEANNYTPPNFHNQAQAVRAMFSMQYRQYNPSGPQPAPVNNYPSFIAHDAYPFRLVGTQYDTSYTQQLGDSMNTWLLDHYEVGMDSTFITAWNIETTENRDLSMFFVPQSFGSAGGHGMWSAPPNPVLNYGSYKYRIPTPQEFRLTCNSALLRQAKALLPYCMTSYIVGPELSLDHNNAGLLDMNNIPYDAPYEEWAYRDRPSSDIYYIPPDSIPPFIDGYDPLYTLPSRPDTIPGSERNTENYLLWKFAAYGRLWNSVKPTLALIARTAPELALLQWWEFNENNADIDYDAQFLPEMFLPAQIKVFTDSTESDCYLFYLNRFCRANNSPYEITVCSSDFPVNTPFSEFALDHSRRFIIEGTPLGQDTWVFTDTLDAGEARLIQMFDDAEGLPADIRITDPDLSVIIPADGDTLIQYRSTPGTQVDVIARFYNMGTESESNIRVCLYDITDDEMIDRTRISFSGLSTDTCYTVDRAIATLHWTPDANDIGVHILKVYAESWSGEPDSTDNSATLVYIITPEDYATVVLDNPWDMTEATGLPHPIWNTNDITGMTGWNLSAYSDSVSGIFEGGITNPTQLNRMFLNTGSDSLDWIDADSYINFSLAGRADRSLDIELHWIDSLGDTSYIETGVSLTSTWQETDPVDLSDISGSTWGGDVKKFWIEFGGTNLSTDVRIGWIRLTE